MATKKQNAYLASCVCVAGRCHLSWHAISAGFQLMTIAIDRDHKQTAPGEPSTIMHRGLQGKTRRSLYK